MLSAGRVAFGPKPAWRASTRNCDTLDRNIYGTDPAYLRSRLSLTGFSKAIVGPQGRFFAHNPITLVGRTHLTNDNLWRWTRLGQP